MQPIPMESEALAFLRTRQMAIILQSGCYIALSKTHVIWKLQAASRNQGRMEHDELHYRPNVWPN